MRRANRLLSNAILWSRTDEPIQGFNSFNNGDNAQVSSTLVKPLPTGGLAGITFSTTYQNLNRPPTNFPLLNHLRTAAIVFCHSASQPAVAAARPGVRPQPGGGRSSPPGLGSGPVWVSSGARTDRSLPT